MFLQETPSPRERFRSAYWHMVRQSDVIRLKLWERSRLTLPQLRILFQIREAPGITTGQLARILGITVSTTSGLITKLVERGLVARGTAPHDRRQVPLQLTPAGEALAGELAEHTRPFLDALADELGPDLDEVILSLDKLTEAATRVREKASSDEQRT